MKTNDGFNLKLARLKAGIKQYELAAKVGISPVQLCEIERGRREVTTELYEKIIAAIRVSVS